MSPGPSNVISLPEVQVSPRHDAQGRQLLGRGTEDYRSKSGQIVELLDWKRRDVELADTSPVTRSMVPMRMREVLCHCDLLSK